MSKQSQTAPEQKVPSDLAKAIAAAPSAVATAWKALTPIARRDFIYWVESAKQAETRSRRVTRACSMLADGKKRPCCFTIVPMDLYSALRDDPKAKATWKVLSPTERREFIAWIDLAKGADEKRLRVNKVCLMLMKGKRRV